MARKFDEKSTILIPFEFDALKYANFLIFTEPKMRTWSRNRTRLRIPRAYLRYFILMPSLSRGCGINSVWPLSRKRERARYRKSFLEFYNNSLNRKNQIGKCKNWRLDTISPAELLDRPTKNVWYETKFSSRCRNELTVINLPRIASKIYVSMSDDRPCTWLEREFHRWKTYCNKNVRGKFEKNWKKNWYM